MSRIRTIKPTFFTSLKIAEIVDPWTRLLFIGLWTHADDDGRFISEPRVIKGAIFPLENIDADEVQAMTSVLHGLGLVEIYTHNARRYGRVTGWKDNQRINRPSASVLPGPDDPGSTIIPAQTAIHGGLTEDSLSAHGGLTEDSLTEGKGREGKGRDCVDLQFTEDSLSAHGGLTESSAKQRPRDLIWDALSERFGEPATKTEKTNRGRQVRELREAGATPEDIAARIDEHGRRREQWTLTANALVSNWTNLAPRARRDGIDPDLGYRMTGQW